MLPDLRPLFGKISGEPAVAVLLQDLLFCVWYIVGLAPVPQSPHEHRRILAVAQKNVNVQAVMQPLDAIDVVDRPAAAPALEALEVGVPDLLYLFSIRR